ncbi:MAG: GTP 3',8-cyclase MoaA [Candidatus Aminicenantes bacterium]|nr:GTP 3',8-cyclase MoaA [Candidatus Aminicenantes bacterium]
MKDKYGRDIDHLRISVTQMCNLSCTYCHHEGEYNPGQEQSPVEIKRFVEVFTELGIRKIKITGGEPLIREDILEIIRSISSIKNIEEISMTTNGTLLEGLAVDLKRVGLSRINIGCDSLTSILPKNTETVGKGLTAAHNAGLNPIKINMVVLKGINDGDIERMIGFARENQVVLQLIELINVDSDFYRRHYFSLENVEKSLERRAYHVRKRKMQARRQYHLDDVIVEIVKPSKNGFCLNCLKIRLTSDGRLKPCLMKKDNLIVSKDKDSILKAFEERCIYAHD